MRYRLPLIAVILLNATAAFVHGQEKTLEPTSQPRSPNCRALVVGIDGCVDSPLNYCVRDAETFRAALRDHCGVPDSQITLMAQGKQNTPELPNASNILAAAQRVASQATADDLLIFFFSGHGAICEGEAYLMPYEAKQCEVEKLVPVSELRRVLRTSRAAWRLLILDACHSGQQAGQEDRRTVEFDVALRVTFGDSEGFVTFASCRGRERSLEAPWYEQGLFTYWLVQGLSGRADVEHAGNGDEFVSLSELYQFVYERVRADASSRLGHMQSPVQIGMIAGDVRLARVGRQPRFARAAECEQWTVLVRREVPLVQLELECQSDGVKLRGCVLSPAEIETIRNRTSGLGFPVNVSEVRVLPEEVAARVANAVETAGATVRECRTRLEGNGGADEHVIDIELKAGPNVQSGEAVRHLAKQYVLDVNRVRPRVYRR